MSPNTERLYPAAIDAAGLLSGSPDELPDTVQLKQALDVHLPSKPATQQVSTVEPWRGRVAEFMRKGLGPSAIFDRLRLQHDDFDVGYQSVKRMVRRLRREQGVRPEQVAIPVATAPGEVAQVDFGYVGKLYDPPVASFVAHGPS